jgi:hypothetical protein
MRHLNPDELESSLLTCLAKLQEAHNEYERTLEMKVDYQNRFYKAKAIAYLNAEGTQMAREAKRDLETSEVGDLFRIAESRAKAMGERIDTLRQELSVYQSLLNVMRSEMGLAR